MVERLGVKLLYIGVADGHTTQPLVVFGELDGLQYRPGSRLHTWQVYWSGQWDSFAVKRRGSVAFV